MTDLSHVTLAVLAGGAGRRMGGPKAWLTINGEPIVSRLHRRLNWPGPALLISSPGRELPPGTERFNAEICDAVAEQGPLRGIYTALNSTDSDLVVVVPVDMPNLLAGSLALLVQAVRDDASINGACFSISGSSRPLPAVLRSTLRDAALQSVRANQLRLRTWQAENRVRPIAFPEWMPSDFFDNLNKPSDMS